MLNPIKKTFIIIISLILLLPLVSCSNQKKLNNKLDNNNALNKTVDVNVIDNYDKYLWNLTVKKYLNEPLWTSINAYDASHVLMLPMHAAFELNESEWQKQISDQFYRFTINGFHKDFTDGRLNRLQYLYLASQFVVLSEKFNKESLIPQGLVEDITQQLIEYWKEPAWQWGRKPFEGGMKERILWKLSQKKVQKSYYRAIIDEELYTFAIAADLQSYEHLSHKQSTASVGISDILDTANKVFTQEVVYLNNTNWLFQPGVWSDHSDYAFVGYQIPEQNMQPKKIRNIAQDSSHFHRFPLWISSLADAYELNSYFNKFYNRLKKGLGNQFIDKVLITPSSDFPAYRTNNFMDGTNGLYRWGYKTQGGNNGYKAYQLSGTLLLGWWRFLGTEKIRDIYLNISKEYPLPQRVINLYVGPNTSRKRNALVVLPYFYTNGFDELIVRLASKKF